MMKLSMKTTREVEDVDDDDDVEEEEEENDGGDEEEDELEIEEEEGEVEEEKEEMRRYIYPIRVTKQEKTNHVNLFLIEKNGVWHYSAITNFSRLVSSQVRKHHGKHWYCYQCLHGFQRQKGENTRHQSKLLTQYLVYCKVEKSQRTTLPKIGESILTFKNIHKQLKCPFAIYADFETKLVTTDDTENIQK